MLTCCDTKTSACRLSSKRSGAVSASQSAITALQAGQSREDASRELPQVEHTNLYDMRLPNQISNTPAIVPTGKNHMKHNPKSATKQPPPLLWLMRLRVAVRSDDTIPATSASFRPGLTRAPQSGQNCAVLETLEEHCEQVTVVIGALLRCGREQSASLGLLDRVSGPSPSQPGLHFFDYAVETDLIGLAGVVIHLSKHRTLVRDVFINQ